MQSVVATSWRGHCREQHAYLAEAGVAYQEDDMETPDGGETSIRAGVGRGSVPLLIVGRRRFQEFSVAADDALLG